MPGNAQPCFEIFRNNQGLEQPSRLGADVNISADDVGRILEADESALDPCWTMCAQVWVNPLGLLTASLYKECSAVGDGMRPL